MKIIVSLTSYPPRIDSVYKVVESLYQQTIPADKILLYLSLDEFPKVEAELPETLTRLVGHGGFELRWVQRNLKSHKKYYYALQEYQDAVVITVDDDKIYANTMVADLIKSYQRFPYAVSARAARIMLRRAETLELYCKWQQGKHLEEYADIPRMDLCALGVGGICYSASLVNEDWFDLESIGKTAANCDDLWLKYHEIINGIPVVYTKPSQNDITIEGSQIYRLTDQNLYGGENDRCMDELSVRLKKQYSACYREWFQNLMTWDKFITEKKEYYRKLYTAEFDRAGNMLIYFYGAGKTAQCMLRILADFGLIHRIAAIIVSDTADNPSDLYGLHVEPQSELSPNKEFGVIFGVNENNKKEIIDKLTGHHYRTIELDMQIIGQYD